MKIVRNTERRNKMATTKKEEPVVPQTPPAAAEQPKVMEVPIEKMQGILDRLDKLETEKKSQAEEIAVLNQTVSKTRLDEAKANLDVDKRPRVHFKVIDGKVVIGWKTDKNEIIFNPSSNLPVGEVLKSTFYFADGTDSGSIDQIKLTRSTEQVHARVIEDLGDTAMLEFEDKSILDKPIQIHKRFWNA